MSVEAGVTTSEHAGRVALVTTGRGLVCSEGTVEEDDRQMAAAVDRRQTTSSLRDASSCTDAIDLTMHAAISSSSPPTVRKSALLNHEYIVQ